MYICCLSVHRILSAKYFLWFPLVVCDSTLDSLCLQVEVFNMQQAVYCACGRANPWLLIIVVISTRRFGLWRSRAGEHVGATMALLCAGNLLGGCGVGGSGKHLIYVQAVDNEVVQLHEGTHEWTARLEGELNWAPQHAPSPV